MRNEAAAALKIFLGAAPGVGKTYEMLLTAQARRREGVDIVVGVVETHGRAETQALLQGLEIIPRRRIDYKHDLHSTVQYNADRLNRIIANLLDMTKLESGALEPNAPSTSPARSSEAHYRAPARFSSITAPRLSR